MGPVTESGRKGDEMSMDTAEINATICALAVRGGCNEPHPGFATVLKREFSRGSYWGGLLPQGHGLPEHLMAITDDGNWRLVDVVDAASQDQADHVLYLVVPDEVWSTLPEMSGELSGDPVAKALGFHGGGYAPAEARRIERDLWHAEMPHLPTIAEAVQAGVAGRSYDTVRWGTVASYAGEAEVELDGLKWRCIGHRPEGSPECVHRNGWVEFRCIGKA